MTVLDIHTHRHAAMDAVVSCSVAEIFEPAPGCLYSVGLHPWQSDQATDAHLQLLERLAEHPQVVAIGETGLDALRGAPLPRQLELLERHIDVAQCVRKPVVAHCVRTSQQLATVWRRKAATGISLAIHGFRGNANVARTLIDAGCYLSYGYRFNTAALAVTPIDRLLVETDDAQVNIQQVVALVADALGIEQEKLERQLRCNAARFLNSLPEEKVQTD